MLSSATPVIDLPNVSTSLGQATPITVHVHDKHGVSKVEASIEQNSTRYPVWSLGQASKAADSSWTFTVGIKTAPQLRDGKATLIVEATSNDLRGKAVRLDHDFTVVSQP